MNATVVAERGASSQLARSEGTPAHNPATFTPVGVE
jgi:hypothetical protein